MPVNPKVVSLPSRSTGHTQATTRRLGLQSNALDLMRNQKQFDPENLLSPHRFVGGIYLNFRKFCIQRS